LQTMGEGGRRHDIQLNDTRQNSLNKSKQCTFFVLPYVAPSVRTSFYLMSCWPNMNYIQIMLSYPQENCSFRIKATSFN